jgi:GNAT superfamily N-acetyltransferase
VFHRSTWSPTTYCYLEDLYVDRGVRRHGTGRALIEAVYKEADKRGSTRTYWATKADNRQARRLYDRVSSLSDFVQYRR